MKGRIEGEIAMMWRFWFPYLSIIILSGSLGSLELALLALEGVLEEAQRELAFLVAVLVDSVEDVVPAEVDVAVAVEADAAVAVADVEEEEADVEAGDDKARVSGCCEHTFYGDLLLIVILSAYLLVMDILKLRDLTRKFDFVRTVMYYLWPREFVGNTILNQQTIALRWNLSLLIRRNTTYG